MGLATSQVRLLSLTSRKADIEMKMELDSKRKTMLMRESTTLSKLYYAKLNAFRYKYSTENGYNDISYNYLMGGGNLSEIPSISKVISGDVIRNVPGLVVTNTQGQAILNDEILEAVLEGYKKFKPTDQTSQIKAAFHTALTLMVKNSALDRDLYNKYVDNSDRSKAEWVNNLADLFEKFGYAGMEKLFNAIEYKDKQIISGGIYYFYNDNLCYSGEMKKGWYFDNNGVSKKDATYMAYLGYTRNESGTEAKLSSATGIPEDSKYNIGAYVVMSQINRNLLEKIRNIFNYYGDTFLYAFQNGSTDQDGKLIKGLNVAAELTTVNGEVVTSGIDIASINNTYHAIDANVAEENEKFLAGLKSGVYTLRSTKNQEYNGLDYFINRGYFVEITDADQREKITAWYNQEKAEIDEKETFWDSEINALSTELETINTEMESIKSLRDNAIQSTFKWGS